MAPGDPVTSIRLPPSLHGELKAIAKQRGTSVSDLLREGAAGTVEKSAGELVTKAIAKGRGPGSVTKSGSDLRARSGSIREVLKKEAPKWAPAAATEQPKVDTKTYAHSGPDPTPAKSESRATTGTAWQITPDELAAFYLKFQKLIDAFAEAEGRDPTAQDQEFVIALKKLAASHLNQPAARERATVNRGEQAVTKSRGEHGPVVNALRGE